MMSHERFTLDELAKQLGRDRREIEKLANRGRIPGRKVGDDWVFHATEITQWLEQEMREYTDRELANLESNYQGETSTDGSPIARLLKKEMVQVPLEARTKRSVLESLVEVAGRTWHVWEPAVLLSAIREREDVLSTGFENGVAIPHPRNPVPESLGDSVMAYGRVLSGIPFGSPNGSLTDIFFLVACRDARTHLRTLARLGRLVQNPDFLETLRHCEDSASSYDTILKFDSEITLADQPAN